MQSRYSQLNPNKYREENQDVYHGFWHGQQISFSREFRGHRFTDAECRALCRGERLEVHNIVGRNCCYAVQGVLESVDYGLGPTFKFVVLDTVPNNPEWQYGMPLYSLPSVTDEVEEEQDTDLHQDEVDTQNVSHHLDALDSIGSMDTMYSHMFDVPEDDGAPEVQGFDEAVLYQENDTEQNVQQSDEMDVYQDDDAIYLDDNTNVEMMDNSSVLYHDEDDMDFPDSDYDDIIVDNESDEHDVLLPQDESDVVQKHDVSDVYDEHEEEQENEDDILSEGFAFIRDDEEDLVLTDEEWAMFLEEDHQVYEMLKDKPLDNPAEPVSQEMLDSVKNRIA